MADGGSITIVRAINNNIVSAKDQNGDEIIVTGKGIGYKATPGAALPKEAIRCVYRMDGARNDVPGSVPQEYTEIAGEIMEHAHNTLGKTLYGRIIFTLADHIVFVVRRCKEGKFFRNELSDEIARFYAPEYAVGIYALGLIERRIGVALPKDEAASVAMYILNAEYDVSVGRLFSATALLEELLGIAAREIGRPVSEGDYYGERFVRHLKYLAVCVAKNEPPTRPADTLYALLRRSRPNEARCAEAIARHVSSGYGYTVSDDEKANLLLHFYKNMPMAKTTGECPCLDSGKKRLSLARRWPPKS